MPGAVPHGLRIVAVRDGDGDKGGSYRATMLRRVRQALHDIRYYGAARQRTPYTVAMDVMLFVTLGLAPLAAWTGTFMGERVAREDVVDGELWIGPGGDLTARLLHQAVPGGTFDSPRYRGAFTVRWRHHARGWPLQLQVDPAPVRVDLDLPTDPAPRRDVELAADDPFRPPITQALLEHGRDDIVTAWREGDPSPHNAWHRWLISIGVWWVMLAFASGIVIRVAWFGTKVRRARHVDRAEDRRRKNRCPTCGYDLTGLEFHERCPECGGLA